MNAGDYCVPTDEAERLCPLTAGSAVVTDDRQQVVVGGLGRAVFRQERLQVQAFKREGNMGAYLGGKHQFMSKALQVDTQSLEQRTTQRSAQFVKTQMKTLHGIYIMLEMCVYLRQTLHFTEFDSVP